MSQTRNRTKHIASFEERLDGVAYRLKAQAEALPPGAQRDEILQKARQAEIASHISTWLSSPGLQPPK